MVPTRLTPLASLRWDVVERLLPTDAKTLLEVGCGAGGFATLLSKRYDYLGFEPDRASFEMARSALAGTDAQLRNQTVDRDLALESRDLLVAFEVLEHIEEDMEAILTWRDLVKPGGSLILSVPAHRSRFACCDEMVGHFRRYDRSDIEHLAFRAGLTVDKLVSYGFPLGFLTESVRNLVCRRRSVQPDRHAATAMSGRLFQPRPGLGQLIALAVWPFRLLQRPFERSQLGTGWVVVLRRR